MSPFRTSIDYSEFWDSQAPVTSDIDALLPAPRDTAWVAEHRARWWQRLDRKQVSAASASSVSAPI
jgi:hypothetical protein